MNTVIIANTSTFWHVLRVHLVSRQMSLVPLAARLVYMGTAARVNHSGLLVFYQGFGAVEGLLN